MNFFYWRIVALQPCGGLGCCSVAQSRPTLCGPMDCIMSDFPVFHYFLKLTHTYVHWVGDAIQPSHPVSPPSLLNINANQYNCIYVCISISPPSEASLPPHFSGLHRAPGWAPPAISHTTGCLSHCYLFSVCPSFSFPCCIHKFILCICVSIPSL